MANATYQINTLSIEKKAKMAIESGRTKQQLTSILRQRGESAASEISKTLLKEFEGHPITKELSKGARSSSGLWGLISYGNLASFYGLEPSALTEDFANFVGLFSVYNVSVTSDKSTFKVKVKFPAINNFYNVARAQMEGYGGSWLERMESIGSFAETIKHYLFAESNVSRSGKGIQVKTAMRKIRPTIVSIPYISDIYGRVLTDGVGKSILRSKVGKKL